MRHTNSRGFSPNGAWRKDPMSAAQAWKVGKLLTTASIPAAQVTAMTQALADHGAGRTVMTKGWASDQIDYLGANQAAGTSPIGPTTVTPRDLQTDLGWGPGKPADLGVYRHADSPDGVAGIYVVRPWVKTLPDGTKADRRRCVRLVELTPGQATRVNEHGEPILIEFTRTPRMLWHLTPAELMDWVEAEPLIRKYGVCISCGRTLKRGVVVELGVGWDCGQRFAGYNDRYAAVQARLKAELQAARAAGSH